MQPAQPQRFDALDGMRGLAALFVMVYHITEQNGLHYARGAHAAVDLFFVLSGFVIMHSYGQAIREGLGFGAFLKARLIRLGPLYMAGLLIGVVAMGAAILHQPDRGIGMREVGAALGLGLVALPYLNDLAWPLGQQAIQGPIFPLNGPAWSLFFEVFINICFFFYLARWRQVSAWGVAGLMAIFLATWFWLGELNAGWGTDNFWAGFPRVAAGFFMGTLLHVWHTRLTYRNTALQMALIAIVFVLFLSASETKALVNALVLAPLAIMAGAHLELGERTRQACELLGELSYPVYIIHVPIHRLLVECFGLEALGAQQQLMVICGLVVACALLLIRGDKAVRAWLRVRLR